jgi:hypothetical protein
MHTLISERVWLLSKKLKLAKHIEKYTLEGLLICHAVVDVGARPGQRWQSKGEPYRHCKPDRSYQEEDDT